MNTLPLVVLLLFKHFICDFLAQTHYQAANKAIYRHPGGVIHALLHGIGTGLVFIYFYSLEIAASCAVIDILVHYHVDWLKAIISRRFKLKPEGVTSRKYWMLFGLDQFIHQMTYIGLILLVPVL